MRPVEGEFFLASVACWGSGPGSVAAKRPFIHCDRRDMNEDELKLN